MELNVLTCRELAEAVAEAVRDLADRAQLLGLDEAGRQLHAQHERADLGLVVVEPPPLEADDVLLGDRLVAGRDQRGQLVADAERRLVALDALDGVALEDEVPIGLGSFAFRTDCRAHWYLLTACSCRPCGYAWYARWRAQSGGSATRVLAQTTKARALFQAARYSCARPQRPAGDALAERGAVRVRTVVRVTSPLNARHPPSHLARRDWHLARGQVAEASSGRNPQPLLMWSGYVRVRPGAYSSQGGMRAVVSYCGV